MSYNLNPSSEITLVDFFNEWQRVAVDKAFKPTYEQLGDLLSYADKLQDAGARLNASRDASIAAATQIMRRRVEKVLGTKQERIFDDLNDALGFAILVGGVVYFWNESDQLKVVWYKEV